MSERPFYKTGWVQVGLGASVMTLGVWGHFIGSSASAGIFWFEILAGVFLILSGVAMVVSKRKPQR